MTMKNALPIILINIVLTILICYLMMEWCGCCDGDPEKKVDTTEEVMIEKEDDGIQDDVTESSSSSEETAIEVKTADDSKKKAPKGKKPWVYFGGKSHDNPTISKREMMAALGIIAKNPEDKSQKFKVIRWEFQAKYGNEVVGHAQVGPEVNEDMKILMEAVKPGDEIYINEAYVSDADGNEFVLDELRLTVK